MLCHFSQQFPSFVETFLEHGTQLRRRFREETITDLIMGSLISIGGAEIRVEFPNEPVTGADMQWDFVNLERRTFIRLLIQAKQIYPNSRGWRQHPYRYLFHRVGGKGAYQVKLICDMARAANSTYPLYALYNHRQTCVADRSNGQLHVSGVNLVSGYKVESLFHAATTPALKRRNKRIGAVRQHLFLLSDILCPQAVIVAGPPTFAGRARPPGPVLVPGYADGHLAYGFPVPPSPEEVRERLIHTLEGFPIVEGEGLRSVPQVGEIPADVLSRVQRPRSRERSAEKEELPFWRVTFVVRRNPVVD